LRQFLHFSYEGTHYRGWQKQRNEANTIQQLIEDVLSKVIHKAIFIYGCGRTDAGVHASQYVAHTDCTEPINDYLTKINFALPSDIVLHQAMVMEEEAHSRFDAVERTYHYHFHLNRNPFKNHISTYVRADQLDINAMQELCDFLLHQREFKNFCKTPDRHKHTICHIKSCYLKFYAEDNRGVISISADRFLKSMVRILVYYLFEVGMHRQSTQDFISLFDGDREKQIHKIAPPQGLFLAKIKYPYLELPNLTQTINF
jgi:tRNA pseudouridine38-40 synthase